MKVNENVKNRIYLYTCFFKLSKNDCIKFYENMETFFINGNKDSLSIDLECMVIQFINNITYVNNLGVTQNIAVWKDTSNI